MCGFESLLGQLSIWNQKNLAQNKYHVYIYIYISANSKKYIRNISVANDEGPSLKLALSQGGSRGNIES